MTTAPKAQTSAIKNSPIGYYDILVSGTSASNYTISYNPGKLSVLPAGNHYLKGWSGSRDVLQIRIYSETSQKSVMSLYTLEGQPVASIQKQLQAGVKFHNEYLKACGRNLYIECECR